MTFSLFVLILSSFILSQTGADGFNIPELFTTLNRTVYIPCYVDTGTDHEHMIPISWTRVGYDGYVETILAPNNVPPSNVESQPSKLNSFASLVVSIKVKSQSGTYTCHTDKGSASTLVHVLDGESIESQHSYTPCSEDFDLVHGKCLYYSNEKKNWINARRDCYERTSSLITFKDVKDLMSFLINLQKSGPTHYEFEMWTGHGYFDESKGFFRALHNEAQVSPMLNKFHASPITCSYLRSVKLAIIFPRTSGQCASFKNNYLCEQPTL